MYRYILFFLLLIAFSSCKVYQSLRYGGVPKQDSYLHFPQRKIENSDSVFYFKRATQPEALGQTIGLTNRDFNSTNITLDSFANLHKTISFLIIRNDTIVYEKYAKKYNDTSLVSSFSMAKPIISTLIGIAIDEGKIKSINDRLIDYLPQFSSRKGWEQITIKDLLHHTSGIRFSDSKYNPLSDNAQFYWGSHLREEMFDVSLEHTPGTVFHYSSENTLLLGCILEKVTGQTVSQYLEEKLWKPLQMEAPAYWSLDRPDSLGIEKVFCCLQGRTVDFAKFGRLYLNEGNWNGKQVVSKQWVNYSTHPDPTGGNKHFFNNNWGIGPLKYGSYYATGLYGQYLYMYPEKKIIIVRFGEADMNFHPGYWTNTFLQIIDQM